MPEVDALLPSMSNEPQRTFRTPEGASNTILLARGAAADVWRVSSPSHPDVRVHKVLRVTPRCFDAVPDDMSVQESYRPSWEKFVEEYLARLRTWSFLEHHNLVKVFELERYDDLSLQVEFCENGCVRDYLKSATNDVNKEKIIVDVLSGLAYLHGHDPPLVHGSLNAGKIFVREDGTAKIGEFGLAALCDPFSSLVPSVSFIGDSRWMSPELIDVDIDEQIVPTTASDVWAMGCTLLEIVTGQLPHAQYKHDIEIQTQVLSKSLPGIYDARFEVVSSVPIWPIIQSCWEFLPCDRPSAYTLLEKLVPSGEFRKSRLSTLLAASHLKSVG